MQEGRGCCTFSSIIITIIREVQVQGFNIRQQTAPLKHDDCEVKYIILKYSATVLKYD